MEQEYAEEEDQGLEQLRERDKPVNRSQTAPLAPSASANASQTSLRFGSSAGASASGHQRAQRSMSATSSSTSLAYKDTESESGSQKGTNRSSFMRFMKGRGSEDDGGSHSCYG